MRNTVERQENKQKPYIVPFNFFLSCKTVLLAHYSYTKIPADNFLPTGMRVRNIQDGGTAHSDFLRPIFCSDMSRHRTYHYRTTVTGAVTTEFSYLIVTIYTPDGKLFTFN